MAVWYRMYEPKEMEDFILSSSMKKRLNKILETKNIGSPIILYGKPGHGKTTFGKFLIRKLGFHYKMFVGGESSVSVIRQELKNFLVSRNKEKKIVLFDEFDRFSPLAKEELKGIITNTANNVGYVFTTNNLHKIPEAIRDSRCVKISMLPKPEEKKEYEKNLMKRLIRIIKDNGYKVTKDNIPTLKFIVNNVRNYNIRKMLVLLQDQYDMYGELNNDISNIYNSDFDDLLEMMKNIETSAIMKKIMDIDEQAFLMYLFDNMFTIFDKDYFIIMGQLLQKYNSTMNNCVDSKIDCYGLCCDIMGIHSKNENMIK